MLRILLLVIVITSTTLLSISQDNVVWKFETKGRVYSTPVIENEIIFIGSGDQSFYAINKLNGEKIWEFKTQGAIHSSPCIDKQSVCFSSADGNLYALNITTGVLLWKFQSAGEKMYDMWDYYLSSPIVNEGVVFWGSGDGNVYAINSEDGSVKWKFKTNDVIHAKPVIYKQSIIVGSFDGNLYCIDITKGSLIWNFKTVGAQYFPKGEIQRAVLIEDGVVYFGSRDYNMYAVNAETGRGVWNMRQSRGWIIAPPVSYKDYIYFGTSDAHLFYCMNKLSGEIAWTIPLHMRAYGSARIKDEIVYFGTFDGKILGVDYLTGKTKWEFQTEKSKANYHTIYNDKGEFKKDFQLYGQDMEGPEAKIHDLGSILSSPVIEGDFIYFGSSDGNLYAVKLK